MPIPLEELAQDLKPEGTILLFGAGSSLPSSAPSVADIVRHLSKQFRQDNEGFSLSELTDLIVQKTRDRRRMIEEITSLFKRARPTGGLLNLPIYNWKSIYTTNYDKLIEISYQKKGVPLEVVDSNFDFGNGGARPNAVRLYKLHGTLGKDTSLGDRSRMIVTGEDYEQTYDYRNHLYNTLKAELAGSNLIIIGHSLSDEDVRSMVNQAISLNAQAMSGGRIVLLMYEGNADRAFLYESKGLRVAFGGVDDFFAALGRRSPGPLFDYVPSDDPMGRIPALVPTVVDVAHQADTGRSDVSRMFNGWPASYSDIEAGLTFERTAAGGVRTYLGSPESAFATILGASGVGKTTAARQALLRLRQDGFWCWEHRTDLRLQTEDWLELARSLKKAGKRGVLFIDDAHVHLREINALVDALVSEELGCLRLVIAAARNSWQPRVKTPHLLKKGEVFTLSKLGGDEIERLLSLAEEKKEIAQLIEESFSGFSKAERRRRLIDRSESDMFVCMKNIFASEKFDNIILREYASLPDQLQDVYRVVSALEYSGVRVHRQMVIRLLQIHMPATMALLHGLTDIVTEYTIDEKKHVYGWRGRHLVISAIIVRHKFHDVNETVQLFDKVIDNVVPTYDIEIRSLVELCNVGTGITRIPEKKTQNRLLRKIISVAPGQRVPRHRLIRNLIELSEFEQAYTEIRIFDKDFGTDGPIARYKIDLEVARAVRTEGIMPEDRLAILETARELAVSAVRKHRQAPAVFTAYCDLGVELFRLSGRIDVFEDALEKLRDAELRLGDPWITRKVRHYSRLIDAGRGCVTETEASRQEQSLNAVESNEFDIE